MLIATAGTRELSLQRTKSLEIKFQIAAAKYTSYPAGCQFQSSMENDSKANEGFCPKVCLGEEKSFYCIFNKNELASIWLRKYARIFVLGHYLFLEAHTFPRTSLLGTDNVREQISVHFFRAK